MFDWLVRVKLTSPMKLNCNHIPKMRLKTCSWQM